MYSMAQSKPTSSAQDIVSCQLCEEDQRLKFQCLECELLMCNKCYEKIHPKFKNASDHRVIDIKDIGKYTLQSSKSDFSDNKCLQHANQSCCLYCTSCELLVCPVCIAKDHTSHAFNEIKDSYLKKVEQLQEKIKDIEIQKSRLKRQSRKIKKQTLNEDKKCEKVLQEIKDEKEAWKKAVNMHFTEITAKMKKRTDEIYQTLSKEQYALDQSIQKLLQREEKSIEMLASQNPSFFLQNIGNLLEDLEDNNLEVLPIKLNSMPNFIPADINQAIFGTLKESIVVQGMHLLVKRKFKTEVNRCHNIAVCDNAMVWVCDITADTHTSDIIIYKLNAETMSKQDKLQILVYDMQPFSHSSVLIADRTSTLRIIKGKEGRIKDSKCNASPFFIIACHVTSNNSIIVGARSSEDAFLVHSQKVVIRFDSKGNVERTWEYDEDKNKIFTSPRYLTSENNGNIFVKDTLSSQNDGRIVILKNEGGILNKYTGHQDINQDGTLFKPFHIKQTLFNNIVICDYNTDTLHLLDSSGHFLTYFDTKVISITKLCSMTFSESGHMLIGTSPDDEKAELYELEINEF